MSNEIAVVTPGEFALFQNNEVNIPELISDNLGEETYQPQDLDRITCPAGGGTTFEVPTFDGVEDVKELEALIVKVQPGRAYWKEELTGEGTPPDCSSTDGIHGTGEPGGLCHNCPLNQFGSAEKGSGKACKESRSVFILTEGALLPYVLSVPPTSIKALKKYMTQLTRFGKSIYGITTKISLAKDKSGSGIAYSKFVFSPGQELTPEQMTAVRQYKDAFTQAMEATKEAVE